MLEEIVICVLGVCHFAALLKPFCVPSHKHAHTENKASPDSFSVSCSTTYLWGSLQAGRELLGPREERGNSSDKIVVKGFLSGSRDEEILHSKEI